MRYISATALVCVSILVTVLLAESVIRMLDGHRIFALRLNEADNVPVLVSPTISDGREYLDDIELAEGVSGDWFDLNPDYKVERKDVSPTLARVDAIARRAATQSFEFYRLWNLNFLKARNCVLWHQRFKFSGRAFAFVPSHEKTTPLYRYLPSEITPLLLKTNNFGMRGRDIGLRKPNNVIRIGFVGASTTVNGHGFPYSYPELIDNRLNHWAEANQLSARFETINLGREGLKSPDNVSVVRYELLPLEPDLVVYYEGANQFDLSSVIRAANGEIPDTPPSAEGGKTGVQGVLEALVPHSALARRIDALALSSERGLGEPQKPDYDFVWPQAIDEFNPPLNGPNLPVNLSNIIRDLDQIREDLDTIGAEMAMTSFVWLASDGMTLDPTKHKSIYNYLNEYKFPTRYRDIERMSNFQNRVFAKYAGTNELPFIDVSKHYPRDPDLFNDAIHQSYPGVRLRTWILLQELIPLIQGRLDSGAWPRQDQLGGTQHPVESDPVITVQFDCDVTSDSTGPKSLPAAHWAPNNTETEITFQDDGSVHVSTAPTPFYYSAQYPPDTLASGDREVVLELKVIKGAISVGILSADFNKWLSQVEVNDAAGQPARTIQLTIPRDSIGAKTLTITNGPNSTSSEFLITNLLVQPGPSDSASNGNDFVAKVEDGLIRKVGDGLVFE